MSPNPQISRRALAAALAALPLAQAWALYDPKPRATLALIPGAWVGSLTYRDWRDATKLVKLACIVSVALTQPDELALYYVFDDGPGKTVYSYERMQVDLEAERVQWTSGVAKPGAVSPGPRAYTIRSAKADAERVDIRFERVETSHTNRYAWAMGKSDWSLSKTEVNAAGVETFRNKYELTRAV